MAREKAAELEDFEGHVGLERTTAAHNEQNTKQQNNKYHEALRALRAFAALDLDLTDRNKVLTQIKTEVDAGRMTLCQL